MNVQNFDFYLTITAAVLNSIVSRPVTELNDVTKPWENPCMWQGRADPRQQQSSNINLTDSVRERCSLSLKDQLTELTISCNEGSDLVGKLSDIMFTKRIQSQKLGDLLLRTRNVTGFPLPGDLESWDTSKPITSVLEKDYVAFQTTLVFLQQMRVEENNSPSGDMTQNFTLVLNKVCDIVCQLKSISDAQGYHVTSNVTSDVMPDDVKNLTSIADRFVRDYVILRDLRTVLDDRKQLYVNILKNV